MTILKKLSLALALSAIYSHSAMATVAYGDLNNFDTVNNTGHKCYGFEIELDGVRSTDITYTYDWNHYGAPVIREDITDTANPKTFVRYTAKTKDSNGLWLEFTNQEDPANPIGPTGGHLCTDPTVNAGCEHFGVGYYGTPTAVKYNWLIDDGSGGGPISIGEVVSVATPTWIAYGANQLPVDPVLNPVPVVQVVAAIPAPEVPIPANKQFGEPSWVKVIKTTTHNNHNVQLIDLVEVDRDKDGHPDWTNGEPDEVESEWYLLQINNNNPAKNLLPAVAADALPNNDESVTRRYEFYSYAGSQATIDYDTGEAMCDAVGQDNSHGSGTVGVTQFDPNINDTYTAQVDCSQETVIGAYTGAQMAGFDPVAALGLIDHIENGNISEPYTNRTVVIGGNWPYTTEITSGALPAGLTIVSETGVLSGTPSAAGNFSFTVTATDSDTIVATKTYSVTIVDPNAPPPQNHAPVANDQQKTTSKNTVVGITLSATDADAGDVLTYSVVEQPANGTLSGSAPNLTYTPAANFFGTDSFTFKANDGNADSNLGTVNIFVRSFNDAPVAVADSVTTPKNVPVTIDVLANDSDVDHDTLTIVSVTLVSKPKPVPGTTLINADGTITFTPKKNWTGTAKYNYTISDGNGGTATSTITITVPKK